MRFFPEIIKNGVLFAMADLTVESLLSKWIDITTIIVNDDNVIVETIARDLGNIVAFNGLTYLLVDVFNVYRLFVP